MPRYQAVPILGGCYSDSDRSWSLQDTVNWLPEQAEQGETRTPSQFKTPPGLRPYVQVSGPNGAKPVRGTYNCENKLFAAVGKGLYQITNQGVAIEQGVIPGNTRVVMTHNQISQGNQLVAVNGSSGYVFNTLTQVYEKITDEAFPGAIWVGFADGYILGIEPGRRFAFNSEPADALNYNALDRFTSEYKPDLIVTGIVNNNELILLNETSYEFFDNTGASQQPFRSKRIYGDVGCGSRFGACNLDSTVFMFGADGKFYRLEGYSWVRISTRPIEQAIRGLNWSQAFCYTWDDGGHSVVYWTFPDGFTWGFDQSTQLWHRKKSLGLDRWRPSSSTQLGQNWYMGDFQSGRIWVMDWDYILEGEDEIERERVTGVLTDNQNLAIVNRLELLFATGQQLTVPVPFPEQPTGPTIIAPPLPDGTNGELWAGGTYTATGGTLPYSFSSRPGTVWIAGTGPMNSLGVVPSGTPTSSGNGVNIARVTDANGLFDEVTDPYVIAPPPFPGVEPPTGIQINGYALDVDIPLPEDINEDDLLIMQAACVTLGTTANVISPVTGWTLIEALQQVNDDTRHLWVGWYYKIADGTETGDVTVAGTQNCGWSGQIHRIETGTYDPAEVPELEMEFIEGPLDVTCPTVTPSWGSNSVLCIAGIGFKYKEVGAIPDVYPLPYNNVTEDSMVSGTAYSSVGSSTGELSGSSMSPGDYHRTTGVAAIVTTVVVKAAP